MLHLISTALINQNPIMEKVTRTTLLVGPSDNGLYSIHLPPLHKPAQIAFSAVRASSDTWHNPHPDLLKSMLFQFSLPDSNKSLSISCNACHMGKSSKLHLLPFTFKSVSVLDLIFCDVWGPSPVKSSNGDSYFLLCVDHFTRYMWIYPLKHKSDVCNIFKQFHLMVERQFQTKLKSVQTDWGGEFQPLSYFSSLGVIHRLSCPNTSEQNGFVERRHRHVVKTGLALLDQSNVPKKFWHFAFDTAVYLINRMPLRTSSKISPFEHIFKRTPDFSFLRVFGCQCYPHLRSYNSHKMEFRSFPCIFLGYNNSHHGYRCLDSKTNRLYIARHVRLNEHFFPFSNPPAPIHVPSSPDPYISFPIHSDPTPSLDIPPTSTTLPASSPTPSTLPSTSPFDPPSHSSTSTSSHPAPPLQTYQRRHKQHSNLPTPATRTRPTNLRQNPPQYKPYNPSAYTTTTASHLSEPTTFTAANTCPQWRQAMSEEFKALISNGTWTLVPPVPNANVDCKWVYKIKRDQNGHITRYKARLVAKGFNQQAGLDYHEMFNLQETVYLRQTPGFVDPAKLNHVCLLHKSLYGLKQAPRAWFHRLSGVLYTLGFTGSKTDPSLFIYSSHGTTLYMLMYVDDIVLTGNNPAAIDNIVKHLQQHFALQDLGALSYFLGIKVIPKGSHLLLSQKKYVLDLLQKAGLSRSKPVSSPCSTSVTLTREDGPFFDNHARYRQINHWSAVKRILRYLQGRANHGLLIQRSASYTLHAYTDADCAGSSDDRRSTGGYAIYLGNNLVSWSARKQRTVSRSSTESEYKALANTIAELTWLEVLLSELNVAMKSTPVLWCDNLGATYLSANPVFHARTKHIEVDFHFVREKVAQGKLLVQFISTHDQIADVFTKPLPFARFTSLQDKLQLLSRA
ncbi:hypothetical protein E3N88_00977 [Mikania micrantha]|uniref:Integrase catalytic domain-containing protein n=1 Tax=Mikania micrantha TaxID=192012 RepID=A0A5N6Q1K2_9ASTR|nr:hypothetical protein E3N88_00977 [Mikania micrantha]